MNVTAYARIARPADDWKVGLARLGGAAAVVLVKARAVERAAALEIPGRDDAIGDTEAASPDWRFAAGRFAEDLVEGRVADPQHVAELRALLEPIARRAPVLRRLHAAALAAQLED